MYADHCKIGGFTTSSPVGLNIDVIAFAPRSSAMVPKRTGILPADSSAKKGKAVARLRRTPKKRANRYPGRDNPLTAVINLIKNTG